MVELSWSKDTGFDLPDTATPQTRTQTMEREFFIDGLRYPPGEYEIKRLGPVPDKREPIF